LFFDAGTSGLPRDWSAPATLVDNWPRLVQLAWVACDADGQGTSIGRPWATLDGRTEVHPTLVVGRPGRSQCGAAAPGKMDAEKQHTAS
jgi:hypothetical protein